MNHNKGEMDNLMPAMENNPIPEESETPVQNDGQANPEQIIEDNPNPNSSSQSEAQQEPPTLLSNFCSFELGYQIGLCYLKIQEEAEEKARRNDRSKMGSIDVYPIDNDPSHDTHFAKAFQKSLQSLLSQIDVNRAIMSLHGASRQTQANIGKSVMDLMNACGFPIPPIPTRDVSISSSTKTFPALMSKLVDVSSPDEGYPRFPECDREVREFFLKLRAAVADGGRKNLFETIRNPYSSARYTGPSPVVSFEVPGETNCRLIGWATDKAQVVEDVKFDIDVVAKMIEKIDCDRKDSCLYTSRNLKEIEMNIDENSFIVKDYVQELVIWGQCLSALHKKVEKYSVKSLKKKASTERLSKNSSPNGKNDHANIVAKFHYKRKIKEIKAELNKVRYKLWLILKSSPDCLRGSSARQVYVAILDYLGVPPATHDSTNDKYMGPLKTTRHVVRIVFSPVPNTDNSEMIEGFGEGDSETEAADESFKSLVQAICSRYIDFLERHENESSTQADLINATLFKKTTADKPDVMRSDTYIDLISSVRAISKSLKENQHHIRLENMFKNLESTLTSACSDDCNQSPAQGQLTSSAAAVSNSNLQPPVTSTSTSGGQSPLVLMPRSRYMALTGSGNPVMQPPVSTSTRTSRSPPAHVMFPQGTEYYRRSSYTLGKNSFQNGNDSINSSRSYIQTQSQSYSPNSFRARRRGDYRNTLDIPPRFNSSSLQNGMGHDNYAPSIAQFYHSPQRTNFGVCHPQSSNNSHSQWLSWNELSGRRHILPPGFNYYPSINGPL